MRKHKAKPSTTDTIIGQDTQIEGKIQSKASIRIDGVVKGDIHSDGDVVIGKHGRIQSHLTARNVYVSGIVNGSIRTKGMMRITDTGQMHGDIAVGSLTIAEGGIFQGTSRLDSSQNTTPLNKDEQKDGKKHLHKVDQPTAAGQ